MRTGLLKLKQPSSIALRAIEQLSFPNYLSKAMEALSITIIMKAKIEKISKKSHFRKKWKFSINARLSGFGYDPLMFLNWHVTHIVWIAGNQPEARKEVSQIHFLASSVSLWKRHGLFVKVKGKHWTHSIHAMSTKNVGVSPLMQKKQTKKWKSADIFYFKLRS